VVVEKPTFVEKIVDRPVEVIKYVEVDRPVESIRIEIIEKIIEKPVYIEKIVEIEKIKEIFVPVDRIVEVERIKEVPMSVEKIQIVERIVEIPIEVIKVQEVEKIVEVFRDRFVAKEESEDCDCLSGIEFIEVWNKLFHLKGVAGTECITKDEFVGLLQKNF
jgi:hypothetical protein